MAPRRAASSSVLVGTLPASAMLKLFAAVFSQDKVSKQSKPTHHLCRPLPNYQLLAEYMPQLRGNVVTLSVPVPLPAATSSSISIHGVM